MNFTDALTRARRALVILPESFVDSESASALFRYVFRKFSSDEITMVIRDDQRFMMASTPPVKTLTYSGEDVNAWFIPRRELCRKIEKNTFDVALDFNVDFSLTSAFLCKTSNAPLRVSFAKQEGDHFYNVQVKTKGKTGTMRTYRNFLKCLDMF